MTTRPPIHCRAAAFDAFRAALARIETEPGLERAAVAIAMHEREDVHPEQVEAHLDALARRVRGDQPTRSERGLIAALHRELFEVLGFTGNAESYYIPENSYLPWVLANRRGIPISLALVLKGVARRLGIRVEGVNAPGHFLAAVHEAGRPPLLMDPFHAGRILSTAEAAAFISRLLGRTLDYDPALMPIATHRQWLLRMLGNLEAVFANQDRGADALAMQELAGLLA